MGKVGWRWYRLWCLAACLHSFVDSFNLEVQRDNTAKQLPNYKIFQFANIRNLKRLPIANFKIFSIRIIKIASHEDFSFFKLVSQASRMFFSSLFLISVHKSSLQILLCKHWSQKR